MKSISEKKYNRLIFKSAAGETAYIQAYEKSMSLWTVPYKTEFVKTRFGDTYVIECGPDEGEPVILISGSAESSAYWFSTVSEISKKYKVFAIDKIGDLGRCITGRFPENRNDYSDWLLDVLNELSIKKANIIGHSYGGWISLGFSINHPERINKTILLSPAGSTCKPSGKFMWLGFKATLFPSRKNVKKFHKWLHLKEELISEQAVIGFQNWRHKMVAPSIFSDVELKQLSLPVLLLIGKEDSTSSCTPFDILNKMKNSIPEFEGEIIPDVGHNFPLERPEVVNDKILNFLN